MNKKPTQLQMYYTAKRKLSEFLREFAELQASDNPLTPEEVRSMIERHPQKFSGLKKWAES